MLDKNININCAENVFVQDQDELVSSSGLWKCVNGCSAVNGCRQNESQWVLCSEWVSSE